MIKKLLIIFFLITPCVDLCQDSIHKDMNIYHYRYYYYFPHVNLNVPKYQTVAFFDEEHNHPDFHIEPHNIVFDVGFYDDELWYYLGMWMDVRNGISNEFSYKDVMIQCGYLIKGKRFNLYLKTFLYIKD